MVLGRAKRGLVAVHPDEEVGNHDVGQLERVGPLGGRGQLDRQRRVLVDEMGAGHLADAEPVDLEFGLGLGDVR